MTEKMTRRGDYAAVWDEYVTKAFPAIRASDPVSARKQEPWRVLNRTDSRYEWPGDEWGSRSDAEQLVDETLDIDRPEYLCEIGAGAGRMTGVVLDRYPDARIISYDVSAEFERHLRRRFEPQIDAGVLTTVLLDDRPFLILEDLERRRLVGQIDAFYSFDAMVHVELHTQFIYWMTAALALKLGGRLAFNVADVTNALGFMKLAANAPGVYRGGGGVGGHFMWTSPDAVRSVLERLGFEVRFYPGNGRDLSVVAVLRERDCSAKLLRQAGASQLTELLARFG